MPVQQKLHWSSALLWSVLWMAAMVNCADSILRLPWFWNWWYLFFLSWREMWVGVSQLWIVNCTHKGSYTFEEILHMGAECPANNAAHSYTTEFYNSCPGAITYLPSHPGFFFFYPCVFIQAIFFYFPVSDAQGHTIIIFSKLLARSLQANFMSGLMSLVPHLPWWGAPLGPLYIHWPLMRARTVELQGRWQGGRVFLQKRQRLQGSSVTSVLLRFKSERVWGFN